MFACISHADHTERMVMIEEAHHCIPPYGQTMIHPWKQDSTSLIALLPPWLTQKKYRRRSCQEHLGTQTKVDDNKLPHLGNNHSGAIMAWVSLEVLITDALSHPSPHYHHHCAFDGNDHVRLSQTDTDLCAIIVNKLDKKVLNRVKHAVQTIKKRTKHQC